MRDLRSAVPREPRLAGLILAVLLLTAMGPGRESTGPGGEGRQARCADCHRPDPLFSHPVGIVPSMDVPLDLPLENGRLVCTTCHTSHSTPSRGRAGGPHLRGTRTGLPLCIRCHDASGTNRSDAHGIGVGVAHYRWPDERERLTFSSSVGGETRLDQESAACLSCHDGTAGTDVLYATRGRRTQPLGAGHPIGVDYRRRGDGSLRPVGGLDRRIHLVDGRVGCRSCHSPYSREPNLLVMSNHGSDLCLSCHAF